MCTLPYQSISPVKHQFKEVFFLNYQVQQKCAVNSLLLICLMHDDFNFSLLIFDDSFIVAYYLVPVSRYKNNLLMTKIIYRNPFKNNVLNSRLFYKEKCKIQKLQKNKDYFKILTNNNN